MMDYNQFLNNICNKIENNNTKIFEKGYLEILETNLLDNYNILDINYGYKIIIQ